MTLGDDERDQARRCPLAPAPRTSADVQPASAACESAYTIAAETGRGEQRAAEVESAPARRGCVRGDDPVGGKGEADADGSVDQEDRLPADELGQCAADEHADRRTGAADGAPGGKSMRSLTSFTEGAHQDRERGRGEHRRAQSLGAPRGEERVRAPGRRRRDRSDT